jgi:DHA1 family bicyclomycin/chloramphenicol resistance-like MFS transporter
MTQADRRGGTTRLVPGSAAFIAVIAALMTMTAMTIDINLPAIPQTAAALGGSLTQGQLTVTVFFGGFALGQLFWGPCSDRFGRKPVMLVGIGLFVLTSALCMLAQTMEQLLALRTVQGVAAGAGAVLGRAIIRDLFEGPDMARIMSLAIAAFITAPIVAPSIGALLLQLGSWRLIFLFLVGYGLALLVVGALLLPESLKQRRPDALRPARIAMGYAAVFGERRSRWFALVGTMAFATLTIYLTNSAVIFMDRYGMDETGFAWVFAVTAIASAAGNLANARLVRRFALARVAAAGLAGKLLAGTAALLIDLQAPASGWVLVPALCGFFFCFGLVVANMSSLALQPHGAIVGTATSALGVVQTVVPATIASLAAAAYDGTAVPMLAVTLACVAAAAVALRQGARALAAYPP